MWGSLCSRAGARRAAALRQAYFPEVQASLERIAAATAKLRAPGFTGTLRVCATPSLTMKWLIPRLSGFQALHPGIDVQLTTQGRSFLDRGGDAGSDVLLRHGYMAHAELSCVHCLDDFHVPVASPRFIERNRLAAPADCLGHPLLKVAGGMDYWPRWFALAKVDVPAQLPGRCSTITSLHAGRHERPGHRAGAVVPAAGRHRRRPAASAVRAAAAAQRRHPCAVPSRRAGGGGAQRFIDWLCGQGTEPSRGA